MLKLNLLLASLFSFKFLLVSPVTTNGESDENIVNEFSSFSSRFDELLLLIDIKSKFLLRIFVKKISSLFVESDDDEEETICKLFAVVVVELIIIGYGHEN